MLAQGSFSYLCLLSSVPLPVKMLRCVNFYEKFCRPLNNPLDFILLSIKDAFLLKFPEHQAMDRVLTQVCRKSDVVQPERVGTSEHRALV